MTGPTASDKRIAFRHMHESGFFLLPNALLPSTPLSSYEHVPGAVRPRQGRRSA